MRPRRSSRGIPFDLAWKAVSGPAYVAEHAGIVGRNFRFDFAWPAQRIALEIDGGIWMKYGGHTTGRGKHRDCVKDWMATQQGWRVIRWTPDMVGVQNAQALAHIINTTPTP